MATSRPIVTPAALNRAIIADGWRPKVAEALREELARQADDAARAARDGADRIVTGLVAAWTERLAEVKTPWLITMAEDGLELGQAELGRATKSYDARWARAWGSTWASAKAEVSIVIPPAAEVLADGTVIWPAEDAPLVARRLSANVAQHVKDTSTVETATSARKYDAVLRQAAVERWTVKQTADEIFMKGLADSEGRAKLMAHHTALWAYNEGAALAYAEEGFDEGEWLVTDDDAQCEFCMQLAGRRVPLGEPFVALDTRLSATRDVEGYDGVRATEMAVPFDILHPPLHPWCRCVIVPVAA